MKSVGLCRRITAYCAGKKQMHLEVSIVSGKGIENGRQFENTTPEVKISGCVYIYVSTCLCSCVNTIIRSTKVDSCIIKVCIILL